MKYGIPASYDSAEQEARRDRAYAQRLMHRPRCQGCGCPVISETYLELDIFGIRGLACEQCVRANTRYTENLEGDYE